MGLASLSREGMLGNLEAVSAPWVGRSHQPRSQRCLFQEAPCPFLPCIISLQPVTEPLPLLLYAISSLTSPRKPSWYPPRSLYFPPHGNCDCEWPCFPQSGGSERTEPAQTPAQERILEVAGQEEGAWRRALPPSLCFLLVEGLKLTMGVHQSLAPPDSRLITGCS